jgi:hypothetical protein
VQLILCFQQTSELDKLTASWGKVIWLCCAGLHVAADAGSAPCHKSVCFNFGEDLLSPTGSINLGFLLRENLLLSSSHLPLGVSQRVLHHHLSGDIKHIFWRRCRGEGVLLQVLSAQTFSGAEISTRGVLHFQPLYFVFVLLSFFCFVLFASLEKHKKISSFFKLLLCLV